MSRGKRLRRGPGEKPEQRRSDAYGMNVASVGSPVAIQLPIATRGVGFSVVLEYSKICAMSSLRDISERCTIFQYYRVALHFVYYKLYLAGCEQHEPISFDGSTDHFVLNEDMRQLFAPVTQVPISTYNIICSIGKIESSVVWHSVPLQGPSLNGKQAALYLYPTNIRQTLTLLADPNSDRNYRQDFHAHNPLPGARWEEQVNNGWVLLNADQIWPANYDADALGADLHSYHNVLNSLAERGPVNFLKNFTWNGKASRSGTVSLDLVPLRLEATFSLTSPPARRRNYRHPVAGQRQAAPVPEIVYGSDTIQGLVTTVLTWSPDSDTSSNEMMAGAASLVGEHTGQPTRLQIQGRQQAYISPRTMLYKIVDSPTIHLRHLM